MALSGPLDPPVTFAVDVSGSVLRVRMSGELDLACAERFDGLFDLRTDGIDTVVLDLGALTFCDVTGVNALTGFASYHRSLGRDVRFLHVLPQVRRVIMLTEDAAQQPRQDSTPA
jgi:anti-anti-sigma factor